MISIHRVLLVLAVAWTAVAGAAGYPERPLRYVIPSAAGGGPDVAARVVMNQLGKQLGRQVIIDNRPGASGIIGTDVIAKATPDGNTLFFGTAGNLAVNPSLYPKLPFNMPRDFTPVSHVASTSSLIYVHPSVPAKTLSELIAYAGANPGKVHYASSGSGGASLPSLFIAITRSIVRPW